jgi:hypothetical protein
MTIGHGIQPGPLLRCLGATAAVADWVVYWPNARTLARCTVVSSSIAHNDRCTLYSLRGRQR